MTANLEAVARACTQKKSKHELSQNLHEDMVFRSYWAVWSAMSKQELYIIGKES